jgi:hypothetical protein
MSGNPANPEMKMLPGAGGAEATSLPAPTGGVIGGTSPSRQLFEMPREELEHLAEEYGLDPTRYKYRQHLVAAIHDRRQMIASMDRDAMLDVIKWGHRPVTYNATKEQIAQEIARIRTMRFEGLSQRGLIVLARLRGVQVSDNETVPACVKKLKKQEGFLSRMNRKRRAMLGSIVANIVGEAEAPPTDYQFVPPPGGVAGPAAPAQPSATGSPTIKHEIEESGLFGGIAGRIKKSADSYVNQKLDEIEARIDRKLDEIDRRLGEWRDKEVANRIRILKITLWASVIVGAFSLVYTYVKVYFWPH